MSMDIKKYIASGILELYVAGLLSEKENSEVHGYAQEYPEIQTEIETIEKAILELSKATSPGLHNNNFKSVKERLGNVIDISQTVSTRKAPWTSYLGWAASLLFAAGMLWMYFENDRLKSEIEIVSDDNKSLEEQILDVRNQVTDTEAILDQLRDKNVAVIALGGQNASPESYAKAYWNAEMQTVFIDAQGLPKPPPGYDYQVWSLKLNPLAPTSIGLLDDFASNEKQLFELPNPNESEAFGITLEPEGGSESPTLEQLYTLGVVSP